jgi:hypothetical protein
LRQLKHISSFQILLRYVCDKKLIGTLVNIAVMGLDDYIAISILLFVRKQSLEGFGA